MLNNDSIIRFERVNKWYGRDFHVLRDIELEIRRGERVVVCGPSGSGKSTLIRCINALEPFQEGRLLVDGVALAPRAARRTRPGSARCSRCGAGSAWCFSSSTCSRT